MTPFQSLMLLRASYLDSALSVIFMVRENVSSQHKEAHLPVLHDGSLLLQPACFQRFLHGSLKTSVSGSRAPFPRYNTLGAS